MHLIFIDKCMPAWTLSVDISDKRSRFRLIKFLREFWEASLANAKITATVIIDTIIADCSRNATDIANVIEISYALKIEGMTYRTPLLRARRHSAADTVELLTNSAIRSTQFLFFTLATYRGDHLLVGANEKLQLMTFQTSILPLQTLLLHLLRWNIRTTQVMFSKALQGVESGMT